MPFYILQGGSQSKCLVFLISCSGAILTLVHLKHEKITEATAQILVVWGLAALLVTLQPRVQIQANYSWRALGLSNIMLRGHGIIVTTMEQNIRLYIRCSTQISTRPRATKQGHVNCSCHVSFKRSQHREQSRRRADNKKKKKKKQKPPKLLSFICQKFEVRLFVFDLKMCLS